MTTTTTTTHHHHHHRPRDPPSSLSTITNAAADSLNASCFTFRKAKGKMTREKASRGVPATKSFRKIGSCEDDGAVEERKVGMRECWKKIDAKFESVLREANLEAVSGVVLSFEFLSVCSFVFALTFLTSLFARDTRTTVFEDPRLRRRDVSETPRRGGFGNNGV
jgi:hypothetical protein